MVMRVVPTSGSAAYDGRMSIRVEFYGIPRQRAGVAETTVELAAASVPLNDVYHQLGQRFPDLARHCFDRAGLRNGYSANLDGAEFITDLSTQLPDGSCLLILSADAGG